MQIRPYTPQSFKGGKPITGKLTKAIVPQKQLERYHELQIKTLKDATDPKSIARSAIYQNTLEKLQDKNA